MARLPIPGSDDGNWGDILNEFLSVEHNPDGSQKTLPTYKGGTGATSISQARANLGIPAGSQSIFIQSSDPGGARPHLWIQTGLGDDGTGMTFWVEDGK